MKLSWLGKASQTHSNLFGVCIILVAGLFFSGMSLAVRWSEGTFHPNTLVFFRMTFQSLVFLPWIATYIKKRPSENRTTRFWMHFWRGTFGVGSMFFLFRALQHIPFALTTLLAMTSVFWGGLLSWFVLGERVRREQAAFGILTVAGVAACIVPHSGGMHWQWSTEGVVYGLLCGLCMGLALTTLRKLRLKLDSKEIVFFFGITGVLAMLPSFVLEPQFPVSWRDVGLALMVAGCGTAGQFLLTVGFRFTTTLTATLTNLQQTPLNVLIGLLILQEVPPSGFWWGAGATWVGLMGFLYWGQKKKGTILP